MVGKAGTLLTIVGTIIGCGFLSGKELVVFFSRFGWWSYIGIFCLLFFFYFVFKFLLGLKSHVIEKISSSKLFLIFNSSVCVIFSAAMFASLQESLDIILPIKIFVFLVIFFLCSLILKKGLKVFGRINNFLVPIMILIFVILLGLNFKFDFSFPRTNLPFPAIFYSLLYCVLNASNSSVVIANLGQKLSEKEKARVAFFAAFVLVLILFFANSVLLENQDSLNAVMPFLSIFPSWQKVVLKFVIILGSLTTLFSLVYNFHISLSKKSKISAYFFSIVLPFALSFIGFGNIVALLEPVASVLSLLVLGFLFKVNLSYKNQHKALTKRKNL